MEFWREKNYFAIRIKNSPPNLPWYKLPCKFLHFPRNKSHCGWWHRSPSYS
jgi:hypothetical protein